MKPGMKKAKRQAARRDAYTAQREREIAHLQRDIEQTERVLKTPYVQAHFMKQARLTARLSKMHSRMLELIPPVKAGV